MHCTGFYVYKYVAVFVTYTFKWANIVAGNYSISRIFNDISYMKNMAADTVRHIF